MRPKRPFDACGVAAPTAAQSRPMNDRTVEYTIGERAYRAYFRVPEGGSLSTAVLVFPDAFGVSDYACAVADRLASQGYRALVADLHGGGRVAGNLGEATAWAAALREDRSEWRRRIRAAYETLGMQPGVDRTRIAAIGFCMGGTACFELARGGASLAAVGTFHPGINAAQPGDSPLSMPVLLQTGADDPFVPPTAIAAIAEELRAGGSDWQIASYGGTVHGFANPRADSHGVTDRLRYNPAVAKRSWAALLAFFAEVLA
jgi:dienelactone hydrolase